ncbi:MAG: hypothetical protein C0179_08320 [Fervidicoccus sp.]|nr:MAG: hypothetical protein C0179_08320 [Fervidicoccus sp.]
MGRIVVSVKLTRDEIRMLEDLSLRLGVSKSEIIRRGLYVLYNMHTSTQRPENKLPESPRLGLDTSPPATVSHEPVSPSAHTSVSVAPRVGKRFIEIEIHEGREGEEEWFSM